MPSPSLKHAVEALAKTPLQLWDGTDFVDSSLLGNIKSNNKDKLDPFIPMSMEAGDPLSTNDTNVIKDGTTGEVYLIVGSNRISHRGIEYQTLYNLIRCFTSFEVYEHVENTAASSGLSYGKEQSENTTNLLYTTYTDLTIISPKSDSLIKNTQQAEYSAYLDAKQTMPLRSHILKDVSSGIEYQFQTSDRFQIESFLCRLTIKGK